MTRSVSFLPCFRCCYDNNGVLAPTADARLASLAKGYMSVLKFDTTVSGDEEAELNIASSCCNAELLEAGLIPDTSCAAYLELRPGANSTGYTSPFSKSFSVSYDMC